MLAPLYFGDTFRFCPNCGKEVVRFAELPRFEREYPKVELEKIEKMHEEYYTKLEYYCRITLTKDEFEDLQEKCKFAVSMKKHGDIAYLSPAVIDAAEMNPKVNSSWDYKKLREKYAKITAKERD